MVIEKKLSVTECLNEIKPYLRDVRITLQKSDTWKVELTNTINFISSKYVEEERVMHSKGSNIEFMFYDNANEVVDELFESLLLRYHIGLETLMRGSDFIFNFVQLLYCKCHKISFKRDGSFFDLIP